jgi:hypothetical protein
MPVIGIRRLRMRSEARPMSHVGGLVGCLRCGGDGRRTTDVDEGLAVQQVELVWVSRPGRQGKVLWSPPALGVAGSLEVR